MHDDSCNRAHRLPKHIIRHQVSAEGHVGGMLHLGGYIAPNRCFTMGAGQQGSVDVVMLRRVQFDAVVVKRQHVRIAVAPLVGR